MKKFLFSFLGTLAGIWISIPLLGLLIFFVIAAFIGASSEKAPELKEGSVLRIPLSGSILDRETEFSFRDFLNEEVSNKISLEQLQAAISKAKDDKNIEGIFLDCQGVEAGLAQCEELINSLKEFKSGGKWVVAYSDNFSQRDYFIASAANEIYVNPVGMIDIHGLSANTFFFKDLLEKIGVEVQVVKVGTFKSAVEPFILNNMSEPNRKQVDHFLSRIWDNMSAQIAKSRKTNADSVNTWADSFCFAQDSSYYKKNKIVDGLMYRHDLESLLAEKSLDNPDDAPRFIDFTDYCPSIQLNEVGKGKKHIALLYAVGDITEDGKGGIASSRLVPQIMELIDDENIEGLVMRVNSGGGSAFASEQIWEALEQYKQQTGNPFYVSMGDMAASGGYYISCGADKIFASPLTLTGSIGIFGMIPNVQNLMSDKLGVNMATVETNKGAFPDIFKPMSPQQRDAMQGYVDRGYKLFVQRCANGRGMTFEQINDVGQGRVWDGKSALESGLIDELGGLKATLTAMAEELGVGYEDLSVDVYPKQEQNIWGALATLSQASAIESFMNNFDPTAALYKRMTEYLKNTDPLQCRANYYIIK